MCLTLGDYIQEVPMSATGTFEIRNYNYKFIHINYQQKSANTSHYQKMLATFSLYNWLKFIKKIIILVGLKRESLQVYNPKDWINL